MTAEPRWWGGVSHPLQLTTGLVIKSITTSPTLAGEHMLFILQVSILSEQMDDSSVSHQPFYVSFLEDSMEHHPPGKVLIIKSGETEVLLELNLN